ncbi:DUF1405 domain-containing protein [Paenibacillus albiflavus]|nr:DUF1405 domain-containing protein [Paenibacillus albiflavus]
MNKGLGISFLWSKHLYMHRSMLWLLFFINLGGTVYGYMWYWQQLLNTAAEKPLWYLPFVPDSPTASLFFTLSIGWLLIDSLRNKDLLNRQQSSWMRGFVEAFALITSFKYGIWAVTMIVAADLLGTPMVWQDWMLIISHLGMAVEVLLYLRLYRFGLGAIAAVAVWALWNDYMDYEQGTFPYLSNVLLNHLDIIQIFTIGLSVVGILIALGYFLYRRRIKV